jgi:hypothetical protein
MMKRENGRVQIDVSVDEWERMLWLTGVAIGGLRREGASIGLFWRHMQLMNSINEGNPEFTPYEIPEEYRKS